MMGYCMVRSSPSSSPLRRVSRAEYPRSQETARLPSLGSCIPTGLLVGQLPRSQEVSTISPAWRLPLCRHKARADRARGRDQAHLRPALPELARIHTVAHCRHALLRRTAGARTVKLAGQEYWPSILNQKEKESEGLVSWWWVAVRYLRDCFLALFWLMQLRLR